MKRLALLAAFLCAAGVAHAETLAAGGNARTAPGSSVQIGTQDSSGNLQAVSPMNPLPETTCPGCTFETDSATGTTAATAATLAKTTTTTTYICGFAIRANATAAVTGDATVTGTITGTLHFTQFTAPAASGIGTIEQRFTPCLPASAANTTIVVTSAAPGTGGVVSVAAWGDQK